MNPFQVLYDRLTHNGLNDEAHALATVLKVAALWDNEKGASAFAFVNTNNPAAEAADRLQAVVPDNRFSRFVIGELRTLARGNR